MNLKDMNYCANDPCEAEAVKMVVHNDEEMTPLCYTCAQAYEWGQASPNANIVDIESVPTPEGE